MLDKKKVPDEKFETARTKIPIIDPIRDEKYDLPICYAKRCTHVRKPVKTPEAAKEMSAKVFECSSCELHSTCTASTVVDQLDQILMFQRRIDDTLNKIFDVLCKILDAVRKR